MVFAIGVILLNILVAYTLLDMAYYRHKCKNSDSETIEITVAWSGLFDSYFVRRVDEDYSCDMCKSIFKSYSPNYCTKCGGRSFKLYHMRKTERYYGLTRGYLGFIILIWAFYALELFGVHAQSQELLLASFMLSSALGGVTLIDSGIGVISSKYSENIKMALLGDSKKMNKIILNSDEYTCNKCKNAIFFKDDEYCKNCGKER